MATVRTMLLLVVLPLAPLGAPQATEGKPSLWAVYYAWDVVLLTSFNEWPETTVVEPSASWTDPYSYLKILAEWKGAAFTPPPLPRVRE